VEYYSSQSGNILYNTLQKLGHRLMSTHHWEVSMQNVAEDLSRTWGAAITGAIEGALEDWHTGQSYDARHLKRTRANYLWDCAISRLRDALSSSADFFFHDVGQTTYIIYKRALRLQLKVINSRGRTSSIPTGRARRFTSQLPLDLDDDDQLTNVFLGYQLDPYETSVQTVLLACPDGARYKWVLQLESEAKPEMELFAGGSVGNSASSGGRLRLRIKKDAEAEDGAVS